MAGEQFASATRQLGRLFQTGTVAGMSEGQLLDRFVTRRDDTAFEAIVARHGPMVLGVCRGILRDPNDVDDAFQATFLVLVKRAGDLRRQELLANWLYGVAYRVARRARDQSLKRSHADAVAIDPPDPSSINHDELDVRPLIHEEVNRLPESYRAAVVLCYLEGQTHEAAATQLGWPIGTVKGRLARAKEMLRTRLTRKGLAVTTTSLAIALAKEARASVPEVLIRTTTHNALTALSAAGFAATTLSPQVVSLAGGVMQAMTYTKLKYLATLAVAGLLSAGGVSAYQQPEAKPEAKKQAKPGTNPVGVSFTEPGDKTPDEIRAEERLKLAEQGLEAMIKAERRQGGGGFGGTANDAGASFPPTSGRQLWLQRVASAKADLAELQRRREGPQFPVNEARRKLKKAVEREELISKNADAIPDGAVPELAKLTARYDVLEAENALRKVEEEAKPAAMSTPDPQAPATAANPKKVHPADLDRNQQISAALEQVVPINFKDETPLQDALNYIKERAKDAKGKSIPIYLNPRGLQEADKTPNSPVVLELDGIPLRTTLRLILEQLVLGYDIHDGLLEITSQSEIEERHNPRPAAKVQMQGAIGGGMMGGGMGGGFQ